MSDLDDIKVGDWLAFVNTRQVAEPLHQQVITVTVRLVKTDSYTFWKDGRAFYSHYKSLTARLATDAEIEKWLSRHGKQQTKTQSNGEYEEQPDVVLARYLTSISADQWLQLGLPQLKKIRAALERSRGE